MTNPQISRASTVLQLPPELAGMVPRRVRLSGGGVALTVVILMLTLGALVSFVVQSAVYARSESERQLREGDAVATDAVIVEVGRTRGEQPRRFVTYVFEADGRRFTRRATLGKGDRRALAAGAPIAIAYLPSRPEASWIAGREPAAFPLWVVPLLPVALLASAGAIAWVLRRQWVLLSEGRAALARIIDSKRIRSDKHKRYRVTYQFHRMSGAVCDGRYDSDRTPPPIGAIVPVVYHRDRPQWSAPYPLRLVRPHR